MVANLTWSGLASGVMCLIFYLFLRRKTTVQVLLQKITGKTYAYWALFALAAFIILHSGTNLLYSPLVGVAAVYLYQRYGSILLCMLVHACANLAGACDLPFVQQYPAIVYILYGLSAAGGAFCVVSLCKAR